MNMWRTETRDRDRVRRLREAGLRATGPRLQILEAIEDDRRHPTADMIHETLQAHHPSLSLSTVYATMEVFARRGLVRRIGTAAGPLRIDGTEQDHDHAVCRICGSVFDIDHELIPRPVHPAQLPHGLRLKSVHVEYEVVCPQCDEQE
jgi:Fe2+ or Zn2+ uptake regulation protein